jgi:hypothetical protein
MECLEDFLDVKVETPVFNIFYLDLNDNKLNSINLSCKSYFFNSEHDFINYMKSRVSSIVFYYHLEKLNTSILLRCVFYVPNPNYKYFDNWYVSLIREKKIKQILDE